MSKHVTLPAVIFLFLFLQNTLAQCPPAGEPVPGDACADAQTVCNLDGYCYTLSFNNMVQSFPGCPSNVLNNDEYIIFIAGTPNLTIEVVPANCLGLNGSSANNGMQAAIYGGDCNNLLPLDAQCACLLTPFTLTVDNLVPGEPYFFVADGCAGDICEYTIHVLDGSTDSGAGGVLSIKSQTAGVCSGQNGNCASACSFSQAVYTVDTSFPVTWTVAGAEGFEVQGNTLTVNWGEPGLGEITATVEGQSCLNDGYICVDILAKPEAAFTSLPVAVNDVLEICQGQTVAFENLSIGAVSYVWNFGNGQYSADANPSFTFENPGQLSVRLIAQNECSCTDTTFLQVNVLAAVSPEIECVSTACQGDETTYTTSADCGVFNWTLNGDGVIVAGGGISDNFMTVEWTGSVGGVIGLSVDNCTDDICMLPTELEAPILNDQIPITGPANVCPGETAVYNIPRFDGSDKNWTVSNLATIVEGQGTSTIVVEWAEEISTFNQQWVKVKVNNCWLECEGTGLKEVGITPELSVKGQIEVCEKTQAWFGSQAWPDVTDVPCTWTVKNELGIPVWSSNVPSDSVLVDMDFGSGRYSIVAVPANPNDVCSDNYTLYFAVIAAPPVPLDILGPTEICPGEWVTYSVSSAAQGNHFIWEIENGLDITQVNGHTINVQWGGTPIYNLTVRQVSEGSLGCLSDPFTKTINPVGGVTVTGDNLLCAGETGEYNAIASNSEKFEWSVFPDGKGTIISGQGTDNIFIFWETSGQATVQASYCGIVESFPVTINTGNEPNILQPPGLCEGATGTVQVLDNLHFIVWQNTNGSVIGNGTSIEVGAGNYLMTGVNEDDCRVHKVIEIQEYFEPIASISVETYMPLCPGGPGVIIEALQMENGLTYQWFHEGNPVGTNSSILWTNDPGLYWVVVSNPGGCSSASDEVVIITCEEAGGVCVNGQCVLPADCPGSGNIDFSFNLTTNCNEVAFQNLSVGFIPGTLSWSFGDPSSGAANTSTELNPTHVYAAPGNYTVWLVGLLPNVNDPANPCIAAEAKNVEIPALAEFEANAACFGTPTQFTSTSAFLANFNVVGWAWNFGDPTSGPQNISIQQNPSHTFNAPGTYTVTLTITLSNGCQVSHTDFVSIPNIQPISIVAEPFACEGSAVEFRGIVPLSAADVLWDFGDPGSGLSNSSIFKETFHAFSGPGNYQVTLTMTTIAGCTRTETVPVQIAENNLGGSITGFPSGAICQGDSVELSAPPGASSFQWSTGETSPTIDVWFTGVFNVTITDINGCQHIPPGYPTQVLPVPIGEIQAVEFDDFGQPINFFYDYYDVCEGEDVTVQVTSQGANGYEWSTGDTSSVLTFTHLHDGTLPTGEYTFYNTITSNVSGCTALVGPMVVEVHPAPDSFLIFSDPPPPLCNLTPIDMVVVNPLADLDYFWSTGEAGTNITTLFAGDYHAFAVDAQGCKGYSNELIVSPGPDPLQVPAGCHSRCNPDTLCLPNLPTVVSYQWYFEGHPIASPNGNVPGLIATESGNYYVEMTDNQGCVTTSGNLNLDLYPGYGDFTGLVYFDLNENGVVDAGDTLMSNVDIQLFSGNILVQTETTDANGAFIFMEIPANGYTVQLDTNSLVLGQGIGIFQFDEEIIGCDQEANFVFLVIPVCIPVADTLTYESCDGQPIIYNGQSLMPGSSQNFVYQSIEACDSTVTVTVLALPAQHDTLYLEACEGFSVSYNGNDLDAGSETDFQYTNIYGCDSVVTVIVETNFPTSFELNTSACEGETFTYQGQTMQPGSTAGFTLMNQAGCDSLVTVNVAFLNVDSIYIDLDVCPGETANYNGMDLGAGANMEFQFVNQAGCDSIVFISVNQFPATVLSLGSDPSCPNTPTGFIDVNASGSTGYTYSLDGSVFQNENFFDNVPSGETFVYVMDENGCMTVQSIQIAALPELHGLLDDEEMPCEAERVMLQPVITSGQFSPLAFEWQDGSNLPRYEAIGPGVFTVEITNDCETMVMGAEVYFEALGDRNYFYVPNSFSPNDDGFNDKFYVYPRDGMEILSFEFHVFDRWGDQFFYTNSVTEGWDGFNKGQNLQPAVFVWFFRAEVAYCGRVFEVFQEGGVHLMR